MIKVNNIEVSIIIVNYNTCDLILACVESIYKHTSGLVYEIIIVDNSSNDDSIERIKHRYPQISIIGNETNLGFGRANNIGVKRSTGEYLFFLNPDTLLLNNAVYILYQFLKLNESIGACGGNLFDDERKPIHSHRLFFPSFFQELDTLFGRIFTLNSVRDVYNPTDIPIEVAYISGADLMIRKSLFIELGGFDERFFMYYEETDLCYRIRKRGFKITNNPLSQIVHLEGRSFELKTTRETMFFESRKKFINKTYSKFYYNSCNVLYFIRCVSRIIICNLFPRYSHQLPIWKFRLKLLFAR